MKRIVAVGICLLLVISGVSIIGSARTGVEENINILPVDRIEVLPDPATVMVGETQQFTATAYDASNNTIPGVTFIWTTDVGDVNSNGLFTAQTTPTVGIVTATNGTVSGSATVNVVVGPINYIDFTPNFISLVVGESQQFNATAYDAYGNEIPGAVFFWSTNVGVVNSTGFFTAQTTPGVGIVTATSGPVSGSATVNVEHGPIAHIIVIPDPITIIVGDSMPMFTVTAYDVYNNEIPGVTFNWTSNIWNETGHYILPPGEAGWINFTCGNCSYNVTVNVIPGAIDHIIVTPNPVSMVVGSTQQFTATAYDVYNNPLPVIDFAWTTDVGSIDATGLFTAQGTSGNGKVTATNGSVSGFANVTVTQTFNIPISNSSESNDWILMSFPNKVSGDPLIIVQDVFDEGGGLVTWDLITTYNATQGKWLTTSTFKPPSLNTFNFINNHMTFWIHITNYGDGIVTIEGDLPTSGEKAVIPLKAGWNLVGYPSLTNETVANALWGTGTDKVEVCDPAEPYNIKEVGPSYVMKPGEGYWVHVPADTVWVVDW